MIHWKYCLIIFIFIEVIYRLLILYNSRLSTEPFYITITNCPNEFLRLKCYLGIQPKNLIMKFLNWYKILFRCRIFQLDFYLSSIIRSIDIILFIALLINLIC